MNFIQLKTGVRRDGKAEPGVISWSKAVSLSV